MHWTVTYFDEYMKEDIVTPNGASVAHILLSPEKLDLSTLGQGSRHHLQDSNTHTVSVMVSLSVKTPGGVSRLEISSLRDSDAGEYVCQLSLLTGLIS